MPNSLPTGTRSRARELMDAARAGDAGRVEALLASGARADERLPGGETPLMRASALGYEDVARALLDAGADANARRGDGFTPLVLAVFFGHGRVARLLLTYGADANVRTRLGTTPEKWAAARGFDEIASLLRSTEGFGAQADARARQTRTPDAPGETASSPARASAKNSARASADSAGAPAGAGAWDSAGPFGGAANVSVRRGGQAPAHPSSYAFRLGGFLRSWQASVGTALLVLAFGVVVYAVWRGGRTPRENPRPAQLSPSPAPQAAPAPSAPAAQASPAVLPTPDAQGGALTPGVPGATYLAPNPAGQPYYVAPGASSPGQAGAPTVPVVISESEAPSPGDASRSKRRDEGGARDAASTAQPVGSRDAAGREAGARSEASGRDARTPDSESQSAPPARQTQPPPATQPSPTPERGKVIQWPPQ